MPRHIATILFLALCTMSTPATALDSEPGFPASAPSTRPARSVPEAAWPALIEARVEIRTTQGQIVAGRLVAVTPTFVTVVTADGQSASVARSTIAGIASEASPAAPAPLAPPAAPADGAVTREHGGAGQVCSAHSDCARPMWCIERLCRFAAEEPRGDGGGRRLSTKGKLRVSGNAAVAPVVVIPDSGESVSGTRLMLSPSIGYFVIDGLEVGLELIVTGAFGDLYDKVASTVSVGPYLRYVFGGHTLQPFVGLGLGPEVHIPSSGDDLVYFDLIVNLGLLVALSDSVALSLGVRPTFSIGTGDARGTIVTVPIGWLGVEAFL